MGNQTEEMEMGLFSWFKKGFKKIGQAINAFVHSSAVQDLLKQELGQFAQAVVAELEYTNLASGEKRAQAIQRILAEGIRSGQDIKENSARLLLELAVASIKVKAPSA